MGVRRFVLSVMAVAILCVVGAGGATLASLIAPARDGTAVLPDHGSAVLTGDLAVNAVVISDVTATDITASRATITWTTDVLATAQVEYGLTDNYGLSRTSWLFGTNHSIDLSGLSAETTYHYRVLSATGLFETPTASGDYTFATSDAGKPVISDVTATDIISTGATITWTTDEPTTSQVMYGLTKAYESSTSVDTALVTSHSVNLTGLLPKTKYHFKVSSADASGNAATSADKTFTTSEAVALVISGVTHKDITTSGATIVWTTNVAATGQVEYGLTEAYGSATTVDPALVTSHTMQLPGLAAGTEYHYRVNSTDASGSTAHSEDCVLTTASPLVISGVAAKDVSTSGATIAWTTSAPATSKVEYGKDASYGTSTSLDSDLVTSHSVALTGLDSNTTYHYRVKSADGSGVSAESMDFTFTTSEMDLDAPVISGVNAVNITQTAATIVWTTDDPAQSQVYYGESANYRLITPLDRDLVTSHRVDLTGLTIGTTYHYLVRSRDASGLWTESADCTFSTAGATNPDGAKSAISGVKDSDVTAHGLRITWVTSKEATCQLDYGLTSSYGSTVMLGDGMETNHSVELTYLEPETTYHYRITSKDGSGNTYQSEDRTFTTAAVAEPSPHIPVWAWVSIGVTGVLVVMGVVVLKV